MYIVLKEKEQEKVGWKKILKEDTEKLDKLF